MERMVAEMTWTEMVSWRAFYELEPFGEKRSDLRVGHAAARLASYFGGKDIRVSDFIADYGTEEPEPPPKPPSYSSVREALIGSLTGGVVPPRPGDSDDG